MAIFVPFAFSVFLLLYKTDYCNYPAVFFLTKFVAGRIMNFERVRNQVMFQLIVLAMLSLVIAKKNHGKLNIKDRVFSMAIPWLYIFVIWNVLYGMILGHDVFQTFIDAYKYLEIIVLFLFFRICWPDNDKLLLGLKALFVIMITLGVIELFITERGGVGLNLVMSFFPMAMMLALYGYINHYMLLFFVSIGIVALSQTRTYIAGFFVMLLVFVYMLPTKKRNALLSRSILFAIPLLFLLIFFGENILGGTISRFAELTAEGFGESGGYRIDEYLVAFEKIKQNPLLGNGFGYLEYMFINKMGFMYWGDFIHCLYIEILFKTGVLGIAWCTGIVGVLIKSLMQYRKFYSNQDPFMLSIIVGGICSTVNWGLTYTFAPLSTYGSMFVGLIVSCIAISNCLESSLVGKSQ